MKIVKRNIKKLFNVQKLAQAMYDAKNDKNFPNRGNYIFNQKKTNQKKNQKIKCTFCDKIIKDENNIYYTLEGKPVCWECWESEVSYPSRLFKFGTEGKEMIYFTKNFGDLEFDEMPTPIEKEKWLKRDGYKGYTDWELIPGYIKITDGWTASYPDVKDKRKNDLNDYFEQLQNEEIVPPCPIYWIFGNTSDIFSSTSCIVIHKSNKSLIENWLKDIGVGLKELAKKFK